MIVLDTNVVSELIRSSPAPQVVRWVDDRDSRDVAITAVTAAELLAGVALFPAGRRRDELAEAVDRMVVDDFADRVLAFDLIAAGHYATVVSGRRSIGRPVTTADAQIAACCLSFGATLATRNTTDFDETGVDLVDPWTATSP